MNELKEIEKIIEIMNKIQKNLDFGNSHFELLKSGNIKLINKKYKTIYYSKKQFIKMYELAKTHNFYGVEI